MKPKAAHLVISSAGGPETLLIIERSEEELPSRYSIVVAVWSDDAFLETKRLTLPALNNGEISDGVDMHVSNGDLLLISNNNANAFEVVNIGDPANITRNAASPLILDFTLGKFSIGGSKGTELIAAIEMSNTQVRIMRIECAPLHLTKIYMFDVSAPASNVLLVGDNLLLGVGHAERYSHHVDCWLLADGGQDIKRVGQVLSVDREVLINCWRAVGQKLVLYDWNHQQLDAFEYVPLFVWR